MKINLNIPKGSDQRSFTDYFNSHFRQRTSGFSGSMTVRDDGFLESVLTGPFKIDQEEVNLTWKIIKSPDAILTHIEVSAYYDGVPDSLWKDAANDFIMSVLTATLLKKKNKYFQRVQFSYIGFQLDGEYWLPGLRFAPAWPEDDMPFMHNTERVMTLDMEVEAIDGMDAISIAREIGRRQAARISLLLDVGIYNPSHEIHWVMPYDNRAQAIKSHRSMSTFLGFGTQVNSMPKKGEICGLGNYNGALSNRYISPGKLLSFPPQARKILRTIDQAPPVVADSFDRCARLYQVALVTGRNYPSVGLAYRVAAIDAVRQADKSHLSFTDFLIKYVHSVTDLTEIADYLYRNVRSAHFHAGEFPLGEFDHQRMFDPIMDDESMNSSELHRMCYHVTREAIVNWIFGLLPDTPEEEC